MSLHAVGDAVEAGHVGTGWVKNKDPNLKVTEVATACKKCKSPWPCAVIVRARSRLTSDGLQK